MNAADLIKYYDLLPHPEGGFYKEIYRSVETLQQQALPKRFTDDRSFSTAIYYLLQAKDFSAFHKIKSDECWHWYYGGSLNIYTIQHNGDVTTTILGNKIYEGQVFQHVVPHDCWFAAEPGKECSFVLTGCTVAPGFDFTDFTLADKRKLKEEYPQHSALIEKLCR